MYVLLNNAVFMFASLYECNHKVTWILLLTILFVRLIHTDLFIAVNLFLLLCNIPLDDSITINHSSVVGHWGASRFCFEFVKTFYYMI